MLVGETDPLRETVCDWLITPSFPSSSEVTGSYEVKV
jgi:hypothetical protein